jgi:hypothetical protein
LHIFDAQRRPGTIKDSSAGGDGVGHDADVTCGRGPSEARNAWHSHFGLSPDTIASMTSGPRASAASALTNTVRHLVQKDRLWQRLQMRSRGIVAGGGRTRVWPCRSAQHQPSARTSKKFTLAASALFFSPSFLPSDPVPAPALFAA